MRRLVVGLLVGSFGFACPLRAQDSGLEQDLGLEQDPGLEQDSGLANVLSAVTLDFKHDGDEARAILTQNAEGAADLHIYFSTAGPNAGEHPFKLVLTKKNVVFAGSMWGQHPSLSINDKGSLVVASTNTAIGRTKWTESLTVVFRNGEFVIAGIAYSAYDGIDPKAGGSCELNLLAGRGMRNGKPVPVTLAPVKLTDWSDENSMPKECQF
jgi:hypothetical protein